MLSLGCPQVPVAVRSPTQRDSKSVRQKSVLISTVACPQQLTVQAIRPSYFDISLDLPVLFAVGLQPQRLGECNSR